jgi:lysophospholipase L1-like esterase
MSSPMRFIVLGDSAAAGIGDSDKHGNNFGWGYYLARAIQSPLVYSNISRPGAQSQEILDVQLKHALDFKPDLAAVIVGGNDLLRNGFSPQKFHHNLRKIVGALSSQNCTVMLLELHDPNKLLKLPKTLAGILDRRINMVNAITRAVAQEFSTKLLQTRTISDIYSKDMWHVDRMHPSKKGHQYLAKNFRKILLDKVPVAPVRISQVHVKTRKESISWMLLKGTPWFFKRSFDLLPAVLFLITKEKILNAFSGLRVKDDNVYFANFTQLSPTGQVNSRYPEVS